MVGRVEAENYIYTETGRRRVTDVKHVILMIAAVALAGCGSLEGAIADNEENLVTAVRLTPFPGAAIKMAMEGRDNTGKDILGMEANPEIASDICTVILVRHDAQKSRKIFNKVN